MIVTYHSWVSMPKCFVRVVFSGVPAEGTALNYSLKRKMMKIKV